MGNYVAIGWIDTVKTHTTRGIDILTVDIQWMSLHIIHFVSPEIRV